MLINGCHVFALAGLPGVVFGFLCVSVRWLTSLSALSVVLQGHCLNLSFFIDLGVTQFVGVALRISKYACRNRLVRLRLLLFRSQSKLGVEIVLAAGSVLQPSVAVLALHHGLCFKILH